MENPQAPRLEGRGKATEQMSPGTPPAQEGRQAHPVPGPPPRQSLGCLSGPGPPPGRQPGPCRQVHDGLTRMNSEPGGPGLRLQPAVYSLGDGGSGPLGLSFPPAKVIRPLPPHGAWPRAGTYAREGLVCLERQGPPFPPAPSCSGPVGHPRATGGDPFGASGRGLWVCFPR